MGPLGLHRRRPGRLRPSLYGNQAPSSGPTRSFNPGSVAGPGWHNGPVVNFDSLRERIAEKADAVLFNEAVTCHDGGAYRAAYVFAWIAAAEGLLSRLDTMGAAQADIGAFVKKFKAEQEAGTAKDVALLVKALSVGFIDTTQYKALDAVRQLRNQYGHPTAAAPSATAAAASIELAVLAVLAKPALLQHGGARQLAEQIGSDPHYIPNDAEAIVGWTVARAPLVADAARPVFIRTLVEQHAKHLGQLDEVLSERCRLVAATAVTEWEPDLTDARWGIDALLKGHGISAAAVFSTAGAWQLLGDDHRYQILSRCLEIPTSQSDPKLTSQLLTRAFELHSEGNLNRLQAALVAERVQAIDGTWLVGAGAPVDLLLGKAAGYLNDGSFKENQRGTRILEALSKHVVATASEPALAEAGAALARAAHRNAFVARNLVREVVGQPGDWPQAFRVALAVEGATQPWLFYDEWAARQAMLLALDDAEIARAVQAAIPGPSERNHVGSKADEVTQHARERIEDGGDKISGDAVPIVLDVLAIVDDRYRAMYGEDA